MGLGSLGVIGQLVKNVVNKAAQAAQPAPHPLAVMLGNLGGPVQMRDQYGPVANVSPELALQRRIASQNPPHQMQRGPLDDLIRHLNMVPPFTGESPYKNVKPWPDAQSPWYARIPAYDSAPGRGYQGDQRRPVPRMTVTPEQQAAIDRMKSSAAAAPFDYTTSGGNYMQINWNKKELQQFNKMVRQRGTPTLSWNGWYPRYTWADGTIYAPQRTKGHLVRRYAS